MQNGPSKNPLTSIQFEEAKKHTDSIKIGRLTQAPLPLSEELWLNILSYLNPQDTLLLKKTNTFFYQFASDYALWRAHIARYFPYLETTHAKEYAENPYKLFFDEVLRYSLTLPFHFLLLALKGSLLEIEEAALDENKKKTLYIFAASNGHLAALTKLESKDKEQAFLNACKKGFLAAAQSLFQQCEADITNVEKGKALQVAIRHGHLSVVTWLLQFANQIPDYEKFICIQEAAQENQIVIFQKLLSVMPHFVITHKDACFTAAAEHNAFSVATFLLEQFGALCLNNWRIQPTYNLLINAAKSGENRLVALLLERWQVLSGQMNAIWQATEAAVETNNLPLVQILCPHDTYTAFYTACEKGKLTIAQWILKHYKEKINTQIKGGALCRTASGRQSEMIAWLLEEFGTSSFKRRLPTGLKWLSALGSHPMMQWVLHKTTGTLSREAKGEALIAAAKEGDIPTLQLLLSQIEDELPTHHKCDALKASAEAGNLQTMQYLLEQCSPAYFAASLRKNMLWAFLENLVLLPDGFIESRAAKMAAEIRESVLLLTADNHDYENSVWLITKYQNELPLNANINVIKSIIRHQARVMTRFQDIVQPSQSLREELLAQAANFNRSSTVQPENCDSRISTLCSTIYKHELSLDIKIGAFKSIVWRQNTALCEVLDIIDAELSDTQRGVLLAYAAEFKTAALQCLLERWNIKISPFYKREAMRNALLLENNRDTVELLSKYCDKEIFGVAKTYVPLQAVATRNAAQDLSSTLDANGPHLRATLS